MEAKEHRWCPTHYIGNKEDPNRLVDIRCLDCNQSTISRVGEDEVKQAIRAANSVNSGYTPREEAVARSVMDS